MTKKTLQYVNGHFELRNPEDTIDDIAFNKLSDCPLSYTDNALKIVRVKSTEDGLEFADETGGYDGDPTVITQDSTHRFVSDTEKSTWNSKQDALVSGTNIKTINSTSLLGSGDIVISGSGLSQQQVMTLASFKI